MLKFIVLLIILQIFNFFQIFVFGYLHKLFCKFYLFTLILLFDKN